MILFQIFGEQDSSMISRCDLGVVCSVIKASVLSQFPILCAITSSGKKLYLFNR
jgi:hypothetical protein